MYALTCGSGELVECFLFPGDGQLFITGGSVSVCRSMLFCDLAVIRGSGGGSSWLFAQATSINNRMRRRG
jgi:hypothetical protein